jgi:hypothetical protein
LVSSAPASVLVEKSGQSLNWESGARPSRNSFDSWCTSGTKSKVLLVQPFGPGSRTSRSQKSGVANDWLEISGLS